MTTEDPDQSKPSGETPEVSEETPVEADLMPSEPDSWFQPKSDASDAENESEPEDAAAAEHDGDADAEPEPEPDSEPEPEPEVVTGSEAAAEPESEPEAEPEAEPTPEPVEEAPPAEFDDSTAERPRVRAEIPPEPIVPPTPADEAFPVTPIPEDAGGGRSGSRIAGIVAGVAVGVLAVGYVGAYAAAGDGLPSGTSVAGIDVGGMSPDDAADKLDNELGPRTAEPVTVTMGKFSAEVDPQTLGMSFDADATVDQSAAGRSLNPVKLWEHYTGGDELDPVVDYKPKAMQRLANKVNRQAGTKPKDGTVSFKAGRIKTTDPKEGDGVAVDDLGAAIASAYLTEERSVDLEPTTVEPEISAADVDKAVTEFAEPAMSGPVTLTFDDTPVELGAGNFADALAMAPEGGELVPKVKMKALRGLLANGLSEDLEKPVDASFEVVNGTPKVVPGKPGVNYKDKQVKTVFLDVVTQTDGERQGEIEATVKHPDRTTKDAEKLGIKEQVSEFTTHFPYAEYRNVNIGRAAEIIDGTVLEPGDTFSLNGIVGERTRENGFTEGWIISDGVFKSELGGAVSQMATTLYNAAYFAGLEDVEHKAHSLYIDRYPIGREATVAWPSVDLKFKNDTEHGVLVKAALTPGNASRQGAITVTMYSTKTWDISSSASGRYAYTSPSKRTIKDGNCEDTVGAQGFSIDVTRTFRKAGSSAIDHTEKQTTVYAPQDEVECWEGGVDPNARAKPDDSNDSGGGN